jgi:serpin B
LKPATNPAGLPCDTLLDLFAEVLEGDDRPNVVLSPLSASMALGMTLNGAAGETFEAMRSTLGYPGMEIVDVNASYRSLIDLLRGLDQNVQFSVANSIWAKEEFPFEDSFFARVTDAFDARIENRDFGDPSTVEAINDWVNDATSGRIEELYEVIPPDLVMLLVNAIYFDGSWTTQFDPDDTRPSDFQLDNGGFVQVDMMSLDETTVSLGGDGLVGVGELTYGRGAYGMVILVPYGQTTAREVAAELGADRWDALLATLDEVDGAQVKLPRFTTSSRRPSSRSTRRARRRRPSPQSGSASTPDRRD